MRAIAAAIVILAGSVLGAAAAIAQAIPAAHGRFGTGEGAIAALASGFLIFVGLCLLLFGWRDAAPRLTPGPPPRARDTLP